MLCWVVLCCPVLCCAVIFFCTHHTPHTHTTHHTPHTTHFRSAISTAQSRRRHRSTPLGLFPFRDWSPPFAPHHHRIASVSAMQGYVQLVDQGPLLQHRWHQPNKPRRQVIGHRMATERLQALAKGPGRSPHHHHHHPFLTDVVLLFPLP